MILGKVIGTVVNVKHAKAAEAWADALLVTGHEAAAHGGDVTTLVLVPAIADAVKIPVIAAGGFADGRGLAAALALGAEGIALGTRLMMTQDSPINGACKALALDKGIADTVYTTRFDGQPCRILVSKGSKKAIRRGLDLPRAFVNSRQIAKMMGMPWGKLAIGVTASGWKNVKQLSFLANAFKAFQVSTLEGDVDKGVLPLGQVVGLIHDLPTVAEVLDRIVHEVEGARDRLDAALS